MSTALLNIFQNLQGNNIHEYKKNFYKQLKSIPLNANDIDSTLEKLQPQNFIQEFFMVDILIYFHRTNELYEILKSGNDVFISKIVKHPWFFEELFKLSHNNCLELVNNVIPNLNYPTRKKVLKKLCRILPESQMDCFYDAILERYGLTTAKAYLPFCSVAKIEQILKEQHFTLKNNYLIQLFRKSPHLLEIYIDGYQKNSKTSFSDVTLLQTVAEENLAFFCKLKEKYKLYTKLGRRVTRKLVDYKRNDIIENKNDYVAILRTDRMVRRLKGDFKQYYFNAHTRNIKDNFLSMNYVKHFPKKYQFNLIQSTFQRVFQSDISSHLDWVDSSLLQMIRTELDERHRLAELKYKSTNEVEYVTYMDSKTALKMIKEKINLTSTIQSRGQLLKQMLEVAKFAYNLDVLEEVLKYYVERHRNEEADSKHNFLNQLHYKEFDMDQFNANHWTYLMQIVTMLKVQESYNYTYHLMRVVAPYLDFLYRNNKSWKDELTRLLEDLITKTATYQVNIPFDLKNPEVKRMAILDGIARMKSEYERDDFVRSTGETLEEIGKFNKKHPKFAINIMENEMIVDAIQASFSENYNTWSFNTCRETIFTVVLEKIFENDNRSEKEAELVKIAYENGFQKKLKPFASLALDLAFKKGKTKEEVKLNKLLWKNNQEENYPFDLCEFIVEYFPKLVLEYSSYFQEQYSAFVLSYVRYYAHIFGELIVSRFEQLLFEEKKLSEARNFIQAYANVCKEEKYRKFLQDYVPDYEKVDLLNDEKKRELFNFQCSVAASTKYFATVDMLLILLKYCKGDFLPYCLAPLHKIFYHFPENLLSENLQLLDKKAVSLRKHYPALSCKLQDWKSALKVLEKVANHEENFSCQKHLIVNAFNLFVQNPTQELFNFLTSHLNFLDKNDEETLNTLIDIQKVEIRFRAAYVAELLKLMCVFEKSENTAGILAYKNKILKNLGEREMKDLDENVCRKDIIGKYFLKPEYEELSLFVGKFVEKYLKFKALNSANETECFEYVYNIIRNEWKTKSRKCREMINIYFKHFHKDSLQLDANTRYVTLQIKHLLTICNPIEFFEQYLRLRLLEIKNNILESNKDETKFSKDYANKVRHFSEEIIAEFGLGVIVKLAIAIRESLPPEFQQLTSFYQFCHNILTSDGQDAASNSYLIVILMLDWYSTPRTVEDQLLCDKIFEILRSNDTKIVQVYLNILLNDKRKFEYLTKKE